MGASVSDSYEMFSDTCENHLENFYISAYCKKSLLKQHLLFLVYVHIGVCSLERQKPVLCKTVIWFVVVRAEAGAHHLCIPPRMRVMTDHGSEWQIPSVKR